MMYRRLEHKSRSQLNNRESIDQLETDTGADLRHDLASDLVIQVTHTKKDKFVEGNRRNDEPHRSSQTKERNLKYRLQERKEEKGRFEERSYREIDRNKKEKDNQVRHQRKDHEKKDFEREKAIVSKTKEKYKISIHRDDG